MPNVPTNKLTKQAVDRLEVRDRDYTVWCTDLTGFGVRVWPSGKKTFLAQYRIGGRGSATRKVTIGQYGTLTTDEARTEAKRILADAVRGLDVAVAKAQKRAELTVSELCDEYMRDGVDHKKSSTVNTDKGRIERHIKPLLGRKKIGDVRRADIERFMRDVRDGKTAATVKTKAKGVARVRGGKGTATRTVRLLGGIFSYAVARGYLKANPRSGVKLYADGKGERFLSPAELQRLGDTLRLAETDGLPWVLNEGVKAKHRPKDAEDRRVVVSPYVAAAVRLLLLTGCRLGEILNLKWEHVDFDRGILNLPDSKTGAKKVVIGAPALQVLSDIPRAKGFVYVIAGNAKDKPRTDIKRAWASITHHAELGDLRLHDLRHSYASVGAAAGMGLPIVGKLLGHASTSTTQRYAHFADDPVRRAADRIGGTIDALLKGQSGQVVPFDKAASE